MKRVQNGFLLAASGHRQSANHNGCRRHPCDGHPHRSVLDWAIVTENPTRGFLADAPVRMLVLRGFHAFDVRCQAVHSLVRVETSTPPHRHRFAKEPAVGRRRRAAFRAGCSQVTVPPISCGCSSPSIFLTGPSVLVKPRHLSASTVTDLHHNAVDV
jgi:hypothetical protein